MKRMGLEGMKNTEYLGHFAQQEYLDAGHNTSATFKTQKIAGASFGAGSPKSGPTRSYGLFPALGNRYNPAGSNYFTGKPLKKPLVGT